jgi:hypothetical protein
MILIKNKILDVIKKCWVSLIILGTIIWLYIFINITKGVYQESFIVGHFGIIFNKLDFSILYRFFTMLLFVNDKEVFGGILVLIIFMARYEYLQGHKRAVMLILLGNFVALIAEYLYLYLYKGYKDYTDLALSNAGWAILGGLVIIFGKKWGTGLLIILLAYNFISIAIPEYSSFQVAHISALIVGLVVQKYFFTNAKINIRL